jgi:hypothetical protein
MRSVAIVGLVLGLGLALPAAAGELPDVVPITVTATSTLAKTKTKTYDAWYVLAPDNVGDRFWCEGKPDEGVGETVVIKLATPAKIDSLTLAVGVWKTDALFHANNIVTGVDVIADGRTQSVAFPEDRTQVEVTLGGAPVSELRLQIAKVKKGRMNDSCIDSVKLNMASPSLILIGADRAQGAGFAPTVKAIAQAITDCDESLLRQHVRFPLAYEDTVPHKNRYANAKAAAKACKSGTFSSVAGLELDIAKVVTDTPGTIELRADVFAWKLVLDGGQWKLVGLEDDTP